MSQINTFLYEQNPLLRAGIISHLKSSEYSVALEAGQLPLQKDPLTDNTLDLLIYGRQCGANFKEELQALKDHYKPRFLAIMSEEVTPDIMQQSLDVGADGLILKNITAQAFIRYLDLIMMGEKIFINSLRHTRDANNHLNLASDITECHKLAQFQLTPREIEIVQCLTSGDPNKLIARKLEITETTVKTHLKAVLRKLDVDNRTQAAILAHSAGFLPHRPAQIC